MTKNTTGTLYIVAGPIGNLKDITLRAIDILKTADIILSEDTRETAKVLRHYNISATQISYREQNHRKVMPKILNLLQQNKTLAVMSDSGTPTISDPGFKLVKEVLDAGFEVASIPGPSAVTSVLSISGLPTDKFVFLGFLPRSAGLRQKALQTYGNLEATLVIYESPYRIKRLLDETYSNLGDRMVYLANDITKFYERSIRDRVSKVIADSDGIKEKGEFVLLVAKEDFK